MPPVAARRAILPRPAHPDAADRARLGEQARLVRDAAAAARALAREPRHRDGGQGAEERPDEDDGADDADVQPARLNPKSKETQA